MNHSIGPTHSWRYCASGIKTYELVPGRDEAFWVRTFTPWPLRAEKQNWHGCSLWQCEKKTENWSFITLSFFVLKAQFYDFLGVFGNLDRNWRAKKRKRKNRTGRHLCHIQSRKTTRENVLFVSAKYSIRCVRKWTISVINRPRWTENRPKLIWPNFPLFFLSLKHIKFEPRPLLSVILP